MEADCGEDRVDDEPETGVATGTTGILLFELVSVAAEVVAVADEVETEEEAAAGFAELEGLESMVVAKYIVVSSLDTVVVMEEVVLVTCRLSKMCAIVLDKKDEFGGFIKDGRKGSRRSIKRYRWLRSVYKSRGTDRI